MRGEGGCLGGEQAVVGFLLLDCYFDDKPLSSLRGVKPIANTVMFCPHSK